MRTEALKEPYALFSCPLNNITLLLPSRSAECQVPCDSNGKQTGMLVALLFSPTCASPEEIWFSPRQVWEVQQRKKHWPGRNAWDLEGMEQIQAKFSGTNLPLYKHTSAWPQAGLSGLTWNVYAGYVGMRPSLRWLRPSGHQAHCGEALRAQRLSWPANPRQARRHAHLCSWCQHSFFVLWQRTFLGWGLLLQHKRAKIKECIF